MQVQQSIASLIGGAMNDLGVSTTAGSDPPPVPLNRNSRGDQIRRCQYPWSQGVGAMGGGVNSIITQLMSLLQQLLSALGVQTPGGQGGTMQPYSGTAQSYFDSAQASSTGDPHLAFDGTNASGTQQSRFDSMNGHGDLLDSSSFQGGFRISTAVTQPDANGITSNRRADVVANYGSTRVSLDNNGQAQLVRNGKTLNIATGQSIDLGANERVTRNADGSLVITEQNNAGGSITTTLRQAGPGVDVNVSAQSVDLGGDLVRHK